MMRCEAGDENKREQGSEPSIAQSIARLEIRERDGVNLNKMVEREDEN